jgi:hypothetical protein
VVVLQVPEAGATGLEAPDPADRETEGELVRDGERPQVSVGVERIADDSKSRRARDLDAIAASARGTEAIRVRVRPDLNGAGVLALLAQRPAGGVDHPQIGARGGRRAGGKEQEQRDDERGSGTAEPQCRYDHFSHPFLEG